MFYPEYLFTKLGEEGSEITKEALKCAVFGKDNFNPAEDPPVINQQKVIDEIHDLLGVLELLVENGLVDWKFERWKVDAKKRKVINYAISQGHLQGEIVEHLEYLEQAIPTLGG